MTTESRDAPAMTKSAYARHRGVSPAMVTKWVKAGRLVMLGELVDAIASDAALAEGFDPSLARSSARASTMSPVIKRGRGRPPLARSATGDLTREKVKRERVRGDLETLAYRQRLNELCEVDRVDRGVEAAFAALREAWLGQAARLHGKLAEEADPRKCYAILEADARSVLSQLADKLADMKASRRSTRN